MSLGNNSFGNCNQLETFNISFNHLSMIPNKIFANCTKLKELILSYNSLEKISDDTFEGLISLEVLKLNRNYIHELSSNPFKSLINLKDLDLGGSCNFEFFNFLLLQHLKNLEVINLSQWNLNFIIIEAMLSGLNNLMEIDVSSNILLDKNF